ncbi:hypothetical protein D3C75_681050 [compost metagenome]
MFLQVSEVLHPGIPHIVGHCQGELGSFQVARKLLHIAIGDELVMKALLRWHPVAEEGIDAAILEAAVDDRHGQAVDLHLVAQAFQQHTGHGIGRGDIAPTGVGHFYGTALRVAVGGVGRGGAQGQGEHGGGELVHGGLSSQSRGAGCG